MESRREARKAKLELRDTTVRLLEQAHVAIKSQLFEHPSSGKMVFTVEMEKAIRIPRRESD